jgi:16S rRNA (guanine(1405)-N(7))-methyltransferase
VEKVYARIFGATGKPRTVLDVACGLNPFALPWMDLGRDVVYTAIDSDARIVEVVNGLLARMGLRPAGECRDGLVSCPEGPFDVALLLKAIPCVEQQEEGSGRRLLEWLNTHWIVVSFPTKSLGGREKGMRMNYGQFMNDMIDGLGFSVEMLDYPSEVFYVLGKAP